MLKFLGAESCQPTEIHRQMRATLRASKILVRGRYRVFTSDRSAVNVPGGTGASRKQSRSISCNFHIFWPLMQTLKRCQFQSDIKVKGTVCEILQPAAFKMLQEWYPVLHDAIGCMSECEW